MKCYIKSAYLCVDNMQRAVMFYENFFEMKPVVYDEIYSVFQLDDFRLGLFAYEKMKEKHIFGSNCLVSISVHDINILKNKLNGLTVCFPLTEIKGNWVSEFVDSEGNHVELTCPVIPKES